MAGSSPAMTVNLLLVSVHQGLISSRLPRFARNDGKWVSLRGARRRSNLGRAVQVGRNAQWHPDPEVPGLHFPSPRRRPGSILPLIPPFQRDVRDRPRLAATPAVYSYFVLDKPATIVYIPPLTIDPDRVARIEEEWDAC